MFTNIKMIKKTDVLPWKSMSSICKPIVDVRYCKYLIDAVKFGERP